MRQEGNLLAPARFRDRLPCCAGKVYAGGSSPHSVCPVPETALRSAARCPWPPAPLHPRSCPPLHPCSPPFTPCVHPTLQPTPPQCCPAHHACTPCFILTDALGQRKRVPHGRPKAQEEQGVLVRAVPGLGRPEKGHGQLPGQGGGQDMGGQMTRTRCARWGWVCSVRRCCAGGGQVLCTCCSRCCIPLLYRTGPPPWYPASPMGGLP